MREVFLVFRNRSSHFYSIENVFNTLIPLLNADTIVLPFESRGFFNRIKNIRSLVQKKAEVIHISGHDHYLLWWPFNKSILTIHDIEALNRKAGLKRWLFKKLWFDIPIKNAKLVTTISEFSKNEILSLNNYKTPIFVVPNPLTIPLMFTPKAFNSQSPHILHIGTKANKNLPRLIEALAGIPCELIIVGQSSEALEKLLNKHHIVYQFKSGLGNGEIITEYNNCDLVTFISTYEGFGLPILEAQAAGRVVLTSNVASMPEVAGKGALLVDPFSINEIKEGILKIINDAELRESLIAHGLANVHRFEPSAIAQQYTALYNTVLNV